MAVQGELGQVLCFSVVSRFRDLMDRSVVSESTLFSSEKTISPSQLQVTYVFFSLLLLPLVPHPKLSCKTKFQGTE